MYNTTYSCQWPNETLTYKLTQYYQLQTLIEFLMYCFTLRCYSNRLSNMKSPFQAKDPKASLSPNYRRNATV